MSAIVPVDLREIRSALKSPENFDMAVTQISHAMLEKPQAPCGVRHLFYPGVYIRELTMLKGTFAVGLRHRVELLNVMVKGRVRILNDDGSSSEMSAPLMFYGKPGTRKVGYVLEDVVWLNVYETSERDVEALERVMFDMDETPRPYLGLAPDDDYANMLQEIGKTEEQVRAESECEHDLCDFPNGPYKVKVGRSRIEGKGLIATADIAQGEVIAYARIGGRRTPAGRYTNHSGDPNATFVVHDGDVFLIALRDIDGCVGGIDGEEITVNYRHVPRAEQLT